VTVYTNARWDAKDREYMGNDSHAAMLIHQTAQRDGKALASPAVHVIRVVEGKIAEF